jgi:hypothetical protein
MGDNMVEPQSTTEGCFDAVKLKQLALDYKSYGQLNKFENAILKCYQIECSTVGESHIETLKTMEMIGDYYTQKKLYNSARPYYEKCLEYRLSKLEYKNIDTLNIMDNLASVYYYLKNYDIGKNLLLKCIQFKIDMLGENDESTIMSLATLGNYYYSLQLYPLSLSTYEKCYENTVNIYGKENRKSLKLLKKIASVHEAMNNIEKAKQLLEELVDTQRNIDKQIGQGTSLDLVVILVEISKFYIKHNLFIDQLKILLECHKLCLEYYGDTDILTLRSSSYLGTYYYRTSQYKEALPFFHDCLEKTTVLYGEMHSETLTSLHNLGKLYMFMGKFSYLLYLNIVKHIFYINL